MGTQLRIEGGGYLSGTTTTSESATSVLAHNAIPLGRKIGREKL
jgi:hypothetical protein